MVHYDQRPVLLGDRVRFGGLTFAGLFKAHIGADPKPHRWVEGSEPRMVEHIEVRSLKYSVKSRCHIKSEIVSLSAQDRAAADAQFGPLGVLDAYLLPGL